MRAEKAEAVTDIQIRADAARNGVMPIRSWAPWAELASGNPFAREDCP